MLTVQVISTTRFLLKILIVSEPIVLVLLTLFPKFVILNLLSIRHEPRDAHIFYQYTFFHTVFTKSDLPYINIYISPGIDKHVMSIPRELGKLDPILLDCCATFP